MSFGSAKMEETQTFSLLDVSSSDDDFLLAFSSEVDSLLDTKANIEDNQSDVMEGEDIRQSSFMELQRPKKSGKCNLRKSLAWDSAFFTSDGVLEPEELSSIMEEAEASVKKKHFLPGIQEDLSKSTDSISTFESDLTLESLEADLFSDIRASIQRSNKPSTLEKFNDTKIHDGDSTNGCPTKIAEASAGNMAKPKLPSKKLNPLVQPPLKSLKPASVSKQVTKPAVRSRESSSSFPRRPDAAGKPNLNGATAMKRLPGRVKLESNAAGNLKAGKAAPLLKTHYQAENAAPKKMAASVCSSGSSVVSKASVRSSRASCDSSSSSSSEIIHNSQTDLKRKMEKNTNIPLGSKTRVPSRVAVKTKSQTGKSNLSDYLKSSTKLSSSISPASSISEWSTESCSSTATVEQKHIDLKRENDSNHEASSNQSSVQASVGTVVPLPRPGFAKPSGLRMPSAKMGYFDGVKAGTKTPNSSSRSRSALPNSLPRSTAGLCTPSASVNKTKPVNTSAKGTPTVGTAKSEQIRNDASIKTAVQLESQSTVLQKVSSAQCVDVVSDISCELLDGGLPYLAVGKNGKVAELGDEKKHVSELVGEKKPVAELADEKKPVAELDDGKKPVADIFDDKKHVAESVSGVREGSHTQMKKATPSGTLLSTNCQALVVAKDGLNIPDMSEHPINVCASPSRVEQKEKCDIIVNNFNFSLEVGETDDLKVVNSHACPDACAENQVDGQIKCMKDTDHKLEMQQKNISASPSSRVEKKKKCNTINVDNMKFSLEVNEADVLKLVNLDVCQDACATNKDGEVTCMEATESKMEMNKERVGGFQSQNIMSDENSFFSTNPTCPKHWHDDDNQTEFAHSANITPCSLPLICLGANPDTRTPFAVKNSGSYVIGTCGSSSDLTVDALVKADTTPHL